jgi:hypothetical protein
MLSRYGGYYSITGEYNSSPSSIYPIEYELFKSRPKLTFSVGGDDIPLGLRFLPRL